MTVATDLSAQLATCSWDEQGLLDPFDDEDRARIEEAAEELLAELYRRAGIR